MQGCPFRTTYCCCTACTINTSSTAVDAVPLYLVQCCISVNMGSRVYGIYVHTPAYDIKWSIPIYSTDPTSITTKHRRFLYTNTAVCCSWSIENGKQHALMLRSPRHQQHGLEGTSIKLSYMFKGTPCFSTRYETRKAATAGP